MNNSALCEISCVSCGGTSFAVLYADHPSKIVRCRQCDLVFFNPQPADDALREFYSSRDGYMPSIEENLKSYRNDPAAWDRSSRTILEKLQEHRGSRKPATLLDIGSAYGFFLLFARSQGWVVSGIERSSESSRYAREQGLDIQTTDLRGASYDEGSFDCITMNNVLEHTLNPVAEIRQCHILLKKNGMLYIAVPNIESLVAQADGFYWKMKSWPNHLFYFSADTLARILTGAGFAVREIFTHAGESDVNHDRRVLRDRLCLRSDQEIDEALDLLWRIGKGQELVIVAQKP